MIRLCSRLQYDPHPAPPALSSYTYALHVGGDAHDPLLALRNTPADVLALSKYPAAGRRPRTTTSIRDPHGVRGPSGERSEWPIIVSSSLPPLDSEQAGSCTAIHGIERSCFTLRDQPQTLQEESTAVSTATSASGASSNSSYHTARATSPSVTSLVSYHTATADQQEEEEEEEEEEAIEDNKAADSIFNPASTIKSDILSPTTTASTTTTSSANRPHSHL